MASAYLTQMAPASTISNCATYQTADSLRWLTHTAYRTKELSNRFADLGFARDERHYWETDPAWRGWRKLVEKALVAWDWGELRRHFSLVVRPAVEEAVLRVSARLADTMGTPCSACSPTRSSGRATAPPMGRGTGAAGARAAREP